MRISNSSSPVHVVLVGLGSADKVHFEKLLSSLVFKLSGIFRMVGSIFLYKYVVNETGNYFEMRCACENMNV